MVPSVSAMATFPGTCSCTLAPLLTEPLPGMSSSKASGQADKLTAIYEPFVSKMWDPRQITTSYASMAFCLPLNGSESKSVFLLAC
jgi:hypothetical protein